MGQVLHGSASTTAAVRRATQHIVIQFRFPPRHADGPTARFIADMSAMRCREHGIEHRLTKPRHPWTNGQSSG